MRRLSLAWALFAWVCLASSTFAAVSLHPNDLLSFAHTAGTTGGGLYEVRVWHNGGPLTEMMFETFCVEIHEGLRLGTSTKYAAVINADNKTVTGNKVLTSYGAWLYTGFVNRTLPGFDNTGTVPFSSLPRYVEQGPGMGTNDVPGGPAGLNFSKLMDSLQIALWHKGIDTPGDAEPYLGYTKQELWPYLGGTQALKVQKWAAFEAQDLIWWTAYEADVQVGKWSGLGNVRVLNLYERGWANDPAHARQDQLAMIPEPGSLAIWTGIGGVALGLAAVRRRRRDRITPRGWPRLSACFPARRQVPHLRQGSKSTCPSGAS
ncbi:MAG: hypothetical protein ACUVUC_14665 [Thermoguttaceae bacterium]